LCISYVVDKRHLLRTRPVLSFGSSVFGGIVTVSLVIL
jgi:hypothetical protein